MNFEQFSAENLPSIRRMLGRKVKNLHDLDDIVQDILLKVHNMIESQTPITNVKNLVWTLCRNELSKFYGRKQRKHIEGGEVENEGRMYNGQESSPEASAPLVEAEEAAAVRVAVTKLKDIDAKVLGRFYFDDASIEEIAAEENAPIGTIKRRLFIARTRLREVMELEAA